MLEWPGLVEISICTISYNQRLFLERCLNSIDLSLARAPSAQVEHIVVDAPSDDGSIDLLRSRQSISHLIIEKDWGPADGLNKAFSQASGKYGYFINSDDYILPSAITNMLQAVNDNPDADILVMGGWIVNNNDQPIRMIQSKKISIDGLLSAKDVMFQPGLLFKMELFNEVRGFNRKNKSCWDLELLVDMIHAGGAVALVNKRIGCFRLHDNGLSGGSGGEAHLQTYQDDLARLRGKYLGMHPKSTAIIKNIKVWTGIMRLRRAILWPFDKLQSKVLWRKDHDGI